MRKLSANGAEKQKDLSTLQHGCTCIAHCSVLDPEEDFSYYYYLHFDDNNSVIGGGVF